MQGSGSELGEETLSWRQKGRGGIGRGDVVKQGWYLLVPGCGRAGKKRRHTATEPQTQGDANGRSLCGLS
jgi:hypothetical protein